MFRTLVAILLLIPAVACAETSLQGVWKGSIGTKAIIACFNANTSASYYYVDYLPPIGLWAGNKNPFWREEDNTGIWILGAPVDGVVAGMWLTNLQAQKRLPIKLVYVDGGDDEAACARDSYNLRLESPPKIEVAKEVIQFSPGRSYRKLRFAGQETIALFGPDPALEQINSFLTLDQSKGAIDAYFQQRREFLGRVGVPAVDERDTEPVYWDENFITVRFFKWAAGTGTSGISNRYQTWSTKTGEAIDLWQWIGVNSNNRGKLPPKLKKFLYKQHVEESPECSGYYRGEGVFTLTLSKSGLNFDESPWGSGGCEKSFFIYYENLRPFLSPAGKKAVSAITETEK